MVHRHASVAKLYEILVESSVRYLRLLEATLLKKLETGERQLDVSLPEVFHFFPEYCDHFITTVYCNNDSEKALSTQNKFIVMIYKKVTSFLNFRGRKRTAAQATEFTAVPSSI